MEGVPGLGVRAIVCTDIVGSTAIRSRIGDDRADALRHDHNELMGGIIATHRGRVLHWTGDGVQCEFTTASAAIARSPNGDITLGYETNYYELTPEQYVLGDYHEVF